MVFIMYPRAAVSASRIQDLLNEDPIIKNPENGVKETEVRGQIEFENVTFAYPDGEADVLKNVSFTAKAGETVAFIGSTGSGKSSLINLIPRFYDVTAGSIKVDGIDVRDYDLNALRSKIGFIPQKALLFSGSIKNNIRFGKKNANEDEIKYSAKVAQAYDFIKRKPKKFDEELSEGGANVSGGQKQRISIARIFLKNPPIIILDEATSALDNVTEREIQESLEDLSKDRTSLIVAHRLSTIKNADEIIVLTDRGIEERGTHEELISKKGIYSNLHSK